MTARTLLLTPLLFASLACEHGEPNTPSDASPPSDSGAASEPAPTAEPAASPEAICAHARDRTRELGELDAAAALRDAPEDQKAEAEARGRAIYEGVAANFVAVCVELDEAGMACMADIDVYVDGLAAAKQGAFACRTKDPDSSACNDEWWPKIDAAEAHPCHEVVEATLDDAYKRSAS